MSADSLKGLLWDMIPASPHPAHMHMALDEVVLASVIAGERRPAIRFWEWIDDALVIGSHQSVSNEVDLEAAQRLGFTVTRRLSGGGTMLCQAARTITYSMYLPATAVEGMSFRESYAALDAWAVRAFNAIGVPASYREINDIISPRGKIAGAAQSRRRGFVLHHTTIAHSMDVEVLPKLIRIGRERVSERGVRSADKAVSPLSWFTSMGCGDTTRHLERFFRDEFSARPAELSADEVQSARGLVESKYATPAWVKRLP